MSYRVFILGTLIIGILTAWYYLTTQLQMQFAQNPDLIPGTNRFPGTIEFLKHKPENLIYGLGVVMFLLAGKVVSVIYEKLDHSRVFFLFCSVLCIVNIFGSIYLISEVSAKTGKLSDLINSEPIFTPQQRILCSRPNATQAICTEYAEWKQERDMLQESVGDVRFLMTIIILSAEIFLGSVAWMLASEYHEKRMGESNALARRQKLLEGDLGKTGDDMSKMDTKLASLNSLKGELETVASQLLSLRNTLPTREYIAKQKQILIDQQLQKGVSALLKKKHVWEVDARSNS